MEVKIRSIGNAIGIIFPKKIINLMKFNVENTVHLEVEEETLVIRQKKESLRENLLQGIQSSQKENLEFAEAFDELETEKWVTHFDEKKRGLIFLFR